jgi:hypothetical protein
MTKRQDDEDEEETTTDGGSTARKAWYAGHAEAEHGISAAYRGVPGVPHGGSQTVKPEQTAGSMDLCWCGQPFDHDWPGKADGRRHPKESQMTTTPASTEEQPRIERRALRAYHADLADIILTAVNEYGVKYRLTAHSVILFPPDKTQPYAINARNGDRQVRGARTWFARHCVPLDKPIKEAAKPAPSTKPVDEEAVKELAEMINSEEHLPKDEPAKAEPPAVKAETPVEPPDGEPASSEEWMPYFVGKSKAERKQHPFYVVNAQGQLKCTKCDEVIGTSRSAGGHTRTHHTDTESLWGKEAKQKAIQTFHSGKLGKQVEDAIKLLQSAIGVEPEQVDTSAKDAEIKTLGKQNGDLKMEVAVLKQQVEDLTTKIADMETKAALAREALGL